MLRTLCTQRFYSWVAPQRESLATLRAPSRGSTLISTPLKSKVRTGEQAGQGEMGATDRTVGCFRHSVPCLCTALPIAFQDLNSTSGRRQRPRSGGLGRGPTLCQRLGEGNFRFSSLQMGGTSREVSSVQVPGSISISNGTSSLSKRLVRTVGGPSAPHGGDPGLR